jgi:hypothetical protein
MRVPRHSAAHTLRPCTACTRWPARSAAQASSPAGAPAGPLARPAAAPGSRPAGTARPPPCPAHAAGDVGGHVIHRTVGNHIQIRTRAEYPLDILNADQVAAAQPQHLIRHVQAITLPVQLSEPACHAPDASADLEERLVPRRLQTAEGDQLVGVTAPWSKNGSGAVATYHLGSSCAARFHHALESGTSSSRHSTRGPWGRTLGWAHRRPQLGRCCAPRNLGAVQSLGGWPVDCTTSWRRLVVRR